MCVEHLMCTFPLFHMLSRALRGVFGDVHFLDTQPFLPGVLLWIHQPLHFECRTYRMSGRGWAGVEDAAGTMPWSDVQFGMLIAYQHPEKIIKAETRGSATYIVIRGLSYFLAEHQKPFWYR